MVADEQQEKTSSSSGRKARATKPPLAGLLRAWPWVALVALMGALALNEYLHVRAARGGWSLYTMEDGLASNIVTSLASAPDGGVWAGTETSGVSHFDGQTWTTYTADDGLADNEVRGIDVGPDGSVWISTGSGLSRFRDQTWTTHTPGEELGIDVSEAIAVGLDGSVWVNTDSGLSRFDGQNWITYTVDDGLADNSVSGIAVAPDGALWALTERGVSRFAGEVWISHATDNALAGRYDGRAMAVTPDGALWIGTLGRGVSRFDGQTWAIYTTDDGLASNDVNDIAMAPDGTLWFGSGGSISRFDGQAWTTYRLDSFAPLRGFSPAAWFLALDSRGRVWIAGRFNGAAVFDEDAGLSQQSLRTWAHRRDTLRLVLSAAAWAIVIIGCGSVSKRLGMQRFWLRWVVANAVSLAAVCAAIYYFVAEPAHIGELWAVALALVVGYVAQWLVLRQRFRRALAVTALLLVIGYVMGVTVGGLVSWPIWSWERQLRQVVVSDLCIAAISWAIAGALSGAITGIGLIWLLRSFAKTQEKEPSDG